MENNGRKKVRLCLACAIILAITPLAAMAQRHPVHQEFLLTKDWHIASSSVVGTDGAAITSPSYAPRSWYPAEVPSTVMGTLVTDGVYKDVFTGDNLRRVPAAQFEVPWWYRTEFNVPGATPQTTVLLEFDGIVYRANVWLNGRLIASADTMKGPFRRFSFDVSGIVAAHNILAVEVIPAKPGEPSIGFADWNPRPPDDNLGLWRTVRVRTSGAVSIGSPFVSSTVDLKTLASAELTVSADVVNTSHERTSCTVAGVIGVSTGKSPRSATAAAAPIHFSRTVALDAGEHRTVTFSAAEFPQLRLQQPRLWWPHDMGAQDMYELTLTCSVAGAASDAYEKKFGIRSVSDYISDNVTRGFVVNGTKIQVLGGGWTDDMFLRNDRAKIKAQLAYVKHMGLNAIRCEGFWGANDDLYDLCDEMGILVMVGWSCQWENDEFIGKHVGEFGGIESPEDIAMISRSWRDQITWLRNHPSIFLWVYASDRMPRPELEKAYLTTLRECDPTRPVVASTGEYTSGLSGRTAVKMRGPYAYVPPVYWWSDKEKGGAFGFATEIGPGAQVPPIESMERMLPKEHLWPPDSIWDFHCSTFTFKTMKDFNATLAARLGTPSSLAEYCTKAQYINYENTRAMYEAFEANKYTATGVIHWMLNTAWPKLWWQLYDYYLNPNASFYGVRKAREPIHILYNYADNGIMIVNNTRNKFDHVTATVRVLNFDLTEKYVQTIQLGVAPDQSIGILTLPAIGGLSTTHFLDLRLMNNGAMVSSNFYVLSTKPDVLDNAKATWYMTPMKHAADLSELNTLEKVRLSVRSRFTRSSAREEVTVVVTNPSKALAFQVVLAVRAGATGAQVLPILWEDNYFPLLPGEKRTIKGSYAVQDLHGTRPVVSVSGWNILN